MKLQLLFTLALAVFLNSCGGGSTDATLVINVGNILSGDPGNLLTDGGIMVWGKSDNGGKFARIVNSTTDTINVPNGTWNFYVIAWNGGADGTSTPTKKMIGETRCGNLNGVSLGGGTQDVNITVNKATCANISAPGGANFAEGASHSAATDGTALDQLRLNVCQWVDTLPTCSNNYASIKGAKVVAVEYIVQNGNLLQTWPGIKSKCISFTANANNTTGVTAPNAMRFPVGKGTDHPSVLKVELYSDDTCATYKGDVVFKKGVGNDETDPAGSAAVVGTMVDAAGTFDIYVKNNLLIPAPTFVVAKDSTSTDLTSGAYSTTVNGLILRLDAIAAGDTVEFFHGSGCVAGNTLGTVAVTGSPQNLTVPNPGLIPDGSSAISFNRTSSGNVSGCVNQALPVTVDNTPPVITKVSGTDGRYSNSAHPSALNDLTVTVEFDEDVTINSGTANLTANITSSNVNLACAAGGAANQLDCSYTIAAGDDSGVNEVTSITFDIATGTADITDTAGNAITANIDLTTTVPALGNLETNNNVYVDTTAPTVTVSKSSAGTNINNTSILAYQWSVVFNEPVDVGSFISNAVYISAPADFSGQAWTITNPSTDEKTFTVQLNTLGTTPTSVAQDGDNLILTHGVGYVVDKAYNYAPTANQPGAETLWDTLAPAAPTAITFTAPTVAVNTNQTLSNTWTDNSTDETGFRIEYFYNDATCAAISENGTMQISVGAGITTATSSAATNTAFGNEDIWYVKVTAFDAAGNETASACSTATAEIDLDAPAQLTAAELSWDNSVLNSDSVTIDSPILAIVTTAGLAWNESGAPMTDGNATDPYTVYYYDNADCTSPELGTSTNPAFSSSDSDSFSHAGVGQYSFRVDTKDDAGNVTTGECIANPLDVVSEPAISSIEIDDSNFLATQQGPIYAKGDIVLIQVNFDDKIDVSTPPSNPTDIQLQIISEEGGPTYSNANFDSWGNNGSEGWIKFAYEVQPGDFNSDFNLGSTNALVTGTNLIREHTGNYASSGAHTTPFITSTSMIAGYERDIPLEGIGTDGNITIAPGGPIVYDVHSDTSLLGRTLSKAVRMMQYDQSMHAIFTSPFVTGDFQEGDEIMLRIVAEGENSTNGCANSASNVYKPGDTFFSRVIHATLTPSPTIHVASNIPDLNPANLSNAPNQGTDFCYIQIVRVPNFNSLNVDRGDNVTFRTDEFQFGGPAPTFTGLSATGIVAMRVAGDLSFGSAPANTYMTLDASFRGYKGGVQLAGPITFQGDGPKGFGEDTTNGIMANGISGSGTALITGAPNVYYGAGGGGNYNAGGKGAEFNAGQSLGSTSIANTQGMGLGASCLFTNTTPCISFGGAGGSANFANQTAQDGNGGGIVMLFAKNYDKSSSFMKLRMEAKGKQGASVSAMGNFTAGGGGAGGTGILYLANAAQPIDNSSLVVEVPGGNSGVMSEPKYGGAGAGGTFILRRCPTVTLNSVNVVNASQIASGNSTQAGAGFYDANIISDPFCL